MRQVKNFKFMQGQISIFIGNEKTQQIGHNENKILTSFLKSENEVQISTASFLLNNCLARPVKRPYLVHLPSKLKGNLQVQPAKFVREIHACNHCRSNFVFGL